MDNNQEPEVDLNQLMQIRRDKLKELQEEVDSFINLDVNHISLYSLILEDNTILKTKKYKEMRKNKKIHR